MNKKVLCKIAALALAGSLCLSGSAAAHTSSETPVVFGGAVLDGTYPITAETEEDFEISNSLLSVSGGHMTVLLLLPDDQVDALYLGTAEEAAEAGVSKWIQTVKNNSGSSTFTLPISVLDQKLCCASYSEETEVWTDHTILFEAASLPADAFPSAEGVKAEELKLADGVYEVSVTMAGGSGRASIQSPTQMTVKDGKVTASIVWSSNHYDYMIVGEQKLLFDGKAEYSTFEIPVEQFDAPISVIADTTAMSTPHEITYRLTFDSASVKKQEPEEAK